MLQSNIPVDHYTDLSFINETTGFAGSESLSKYRANVFVDLTMENVSFTVPHSTSNFLFLNENRCIGIGRHYETVFLPYGDIFLTNDTWRTLSQKTFSPQSEAIGFNAIGKVKNSQVIMIVNGVINSTVIELRY